MILIGVGLIALAFAYWIVGPPTAGVSVKQYLTDQKIQREINANQIRINKSLFDFDKAQHRINDSQLKLNSFYRG